MADATPNRPTLLRRFEACLRKGNGLLDMRWQLTQAGMTDADVRAVELRIRRLIRSERAGRKAA